MKAISTTADGRQNEAEDLLMAVVKSDDAHGPHILAADMNTGEKTQLIFSMVEILQLYIWSYDVLRQSGKIGEGLCS
jgi:hypothetical protein